MLTDKITGQILTFDEAMEKVKLMTVEEKLEILDQIYKQLGIQPLNKGAWIVNNYPIFQPPEV